MYLWWQLTEGREMSRSWRLFSTRRTQWQTLRWVGEQSAHAQTKNFFSYSSSSWVRWRMGSVKVGRWRRTLMQCRRQKTLRFKQCEWLRKGTWKMPWSCWRGQSMRHRTMPLPTTTEHRYQDPCYHGNMGLLRVKCCTLACWHEHVQRRFEREERSKSEVCRHWCHSHGKPPFILHTQGRRQWYAVPVFEGEKMALLGF